jgi:hypothetical protein
VHCWLPFPVPIKPLLLLLLLQWLLAGPIA